MKFLAIFCYVICLAACSGTNPPATISPDVVMKIEETLPPSSPSIPSPTTIQLPTSTATTKVPLPTFTNNPTNTPFPRATPVLPTLPDWVTDPSTSTLILGNSGNPFVSVFNPENGDLVIASKNTVLNAIGEEPDRISNSDLDTISSNGRYQAKILLENGEVHITVLDEESNSTTNLINPFLNHTTRDEDFNEYAVAHWSPDSEFLSVQYEKHYYSDNYDRNLVIYKPTGEIFRQYTKMDAAWRDPWSPTAPYKILSTNRAIPCILNVIENEKTCLEEIGEWRESENTLPFHYVWSPDGNQLSFIHNNSDMPKTGLCYIELTTHDIKCFITPDELHIDQQLFATVQYWSPDGNYLVVFFDKFGAYSDVFGESNKVAVVNIDGNNLQLLEGEYKPPMGNPWRSLITSQID